ncbi:MAG: gliding motility-associated C-terminal domain-containing protein, partial [Bacteroidota bacterium]
GGTSPYSYSWNNGDNNSILANISSGNYTLTLTDDNGCLKTGAYTLIDPTAIVIVGNAGVSQNHFGYVNTNSEGGYPPYTYTWSSGHNTQSIENLYTGIYILSVTDFYGCTAIDTFDIEIPLLIPTVITPNSDGYNDTWNILNIETYESVFIEIYNRWGDIVFQYSGPGTGYKNESVQWDGKWNGNDLPFYSYVYIIELNGKNEVYNGIVTLKK